MTLAERQLEIVTRAAPLVDALQVRDYVALRQLTMAEDPAARPLLEERFVAFYALNDTLADEGLRRRVFAALYALTLPVEPGTYTRALQQLAGPQATGERQILHASLASKLVSLRDEGSPIYDRHVSRFFGLVVPGEGDLDYRIALYLDHLERVNRTYMGWATNPAFCRATAQLCERIPALATCHPVRVCDFLVQTAVRHWRQVAHDTAQAHSRAVR